MEIERGTNEYYGDEDEKDDYEPDYDSENDERKLEDHDEEPYDYYEHDCCRGDCK